MTRRIIHLRYEDRNFRLTPALDKAGYTVPLTVLSREGFATRADKLRDRLRYEAELAAYNNHGCGFGTASSSPTERNDS